MKKRNSINIIGLEEEYAPNYSPFTDITKAELTRRAIASLDEAERRLILLYVEIGSHRKLGKLLNISAATSWHTINKIKQKVIQYVQSHT